MFILDLGLVVHCTIYALVSFFLSANGMIPVWQSLLCFFWMLLPFKFRFVRKFELAASERATASLSKVPLHSLDWKYVA